jgi:hypothetical protein
VDFLRLMHRLLTQHQTVPVNAMGKSRNTGHRGLDRRYGHEERIHHFTATRGSASSSCSGAPRGGAAGSGGPILQHKQTCRFPEIAIELPGLVRDVHTTLTTGADHGELVVGSCFVGQGVGGHIEGRIAVHQ